MRAWTRLKPVGERQCAHCGKVFTFYHPSATYCGSACRHSVKNAGRRVYGSNRIPEDPIKNPHPKDRKQVHELLMKWA